MALQASGAISLSQLQAEFGGTNPISVSEYYKNGAYVPSSVQTTASAYNMSFTESGGSAGWPSPVFWRYYENGSGPLPTINPDANTLYIHSFWTDKAWTVGTSVCDVNLRVDRNGTYTANCGGYNTGATRYMEVFVNGVSRGATSYGNVVFSCNAGDLIRLYCTMNTIGNYNAHTVTLTPRTQSQTVNTNIPTSGVVSFSNYYSGQKNYE